MGAGTKIKTGILLSLTVILYIIHVIFASLAATGTPARLFPLPVGNASDALKLLITPVGATFTIWGVIYFWQFLWIVYALVSLCRNGPATNLLSGKFYGAFMISTIFITAWFFTWTRLDTVESLIMIALHQIFVEVALWQACSNLREYLDTQPITSENKGDVWAHRILIQNGILFYLTWTYVALLLSFSIVLNKELDVSDQSASLASLIILSILAIVYFIVENYVYNIYLEFTFTHYVALIWALSGVFANSWGVNDAVGGLTLALLIVVVLMLIARIVILVLRNRRRESYDSIEYDNQTQTVNA